MRFELALIVTSVLVIHVAIMVLTWFSNRCKPMLDRFTIMRSETIDLHKVAKRYEKLLEVPQVLLVAPQLKIINEAKKVESRLILEGFLVILSGMIPSGLIAIYFNN
tara:strand:- start:192 stop:512 length:321 start_codon:yes stop_codon:yes gene_type:complete